MKKPFKAGDVIRSCEPYFGEPGYRVVREDTYGLVVTHATNKTGLTCIIPWHCLWASDGKPVYTKCGLFMRIYLWLIR